MASADVLSPLMSPTSPTVPASVKVAFDRKRVFELAKKLSDDNRFYFQCISSSQFRARFASTCEKMSNNLTTLESFGDTFSNQMSKFDFDETHPGNGYRSVAAVLDSCILNVIRLLKDIKQMRHNLLFRANHFCKELEAYGSVLDALRRDLDCVKDYVDFWKNGDLFPPEHSRPKLNALMNLIESYDHSSFYGRCMGFQYASSLYRVFQVIGISLASYSLVWERGNCETWTGTASALFRSGRFMLDPEERAKRISDVITNADISFCKSFWSLTEAPIIQDVPKWFCPNLALNEVWNITCNDSLFIQSTNGGKVKITPPTAHTGPRPLPLRVMSFRLREGMPSKSLLSRSTENVQSKSPCLLFHCHGGGFVATSSKTHEIYLRHWAKLLDCTVVSVDYSLAPENPYPRAVEESLYAYAWVLLNADRLGWTGERICFVGDSAGGHLLMATALRAINMGVERLPNGLVMIYAPFLIEYNPSPSRLLSFMDPLLPPGITARCIAAYIGEPESPTTKLNGTSNKLTRPKLTEYAANLKKETSENRSAMSSISSPTSDEKKANEIINFCLINKPSASSNSREHSPTSKTNDNSSEGSSTRWDKPKTVANRQRSHSDPRFDLSSLAEEDDYYEESSTPIIEPLKSENSEIGSSYEMTTVKIERDPNRIFLTSSAYDQDFITYLSEHELTRKSCVRLRIPSPVRSSRKQDISLEGSAFSSSPSLDGPLSAKIPRVENPRTNGHSRSYSTGSLSAMSLTIGTKLGTMTGYVVDGISSFLEKPSSDSSAGSDKATESVSCLSQFHDLKVPKDPFLSPLYADDEMIAKLPPVSFVAGHLDPLLDDTIAFAKKLQRNKVKITLDLLDALPHGFLNFTLWSPDCRDGAKVCLQRIRDRLNLDNE